jgi:uracil-DNA glycosylase family 4
MFDQAADVVLRALRERVSNGARLRASAESISRLRGSSGDPSAVRSQVVQIAGSQNRSNSGHAALQACDSKVAGCNFCETADGLKAGGILQCEVNPSDSRELLLVGEAACSCEDAEFAGFGGASGELLLRMLKTMGLTRDSVNMVNVVVCEKAEHGRAMQLIEAMRPRCRSALGEVVQKQRPRAIIAMGSNAAAAMFDSVASVESSRSVWRDFEGVPTMTTFHATHLIQNPAIAERRKVWEDLMRVMEKLGLPVSERQRGFFLQ